MATSSAPTVAAYLASLPPERRKVVAAVRRQVRAGIPKGYVERMGYGMISYEIPLSRYPVTYNRKPLCYIALAAQKTNYALHLVGAYMNPPLRRRIEATFKAAGLRLDMGRGCLRFKALEDLPPGFVTEVAAAVPVEKFLEVYERVHPPKGRRTGAKLKR